MKFTRIAAVFVVGALALGLAACGDEEADNQSKSEVTEAANTICTNFAKRIDAIDTPTDIRNTEQAATYWGEAAPVVEAKHSELKALDPDDDLVDEYNAYIRKIAELEKLTMTVADKTSEGDRSYINDLEEVDSVAKDAREMAGAIGASQCAKDNQNPGLPDQSDNQ